MNYENNVFVYLKWRKDLSFIDSPFNEVDALILSELAYIYLDGIVPGVEEDGAITIREANKAYTKTSAKILNYSGKEELFDLLADSPRFADVFICNYVNKVDATLQQQFAAMHFIIMPNVTYVAFRGTDNTIVGWREDFNMSYMMPVPAQQTAVDYVNATLKGMFHRYYLGGHSKGGNLAIYSGVFCNPRIQKKLIQVYSFDGPGFNRKMVDDDAYIAVRKKIHAFIPEASIVGLLMEHEEDYTIVKSSGNGMMQHEGLTWQVEGTKFLQAEELDKNSKDISARIAEWLAKVSHQERKQIVDSFFNIFERAGFVVFDDVFEMDAKKAGVLLKAVATVPKEERELVGKLVKLFIEVNTKK